MTRVTALLPPTGAARRRRRSLTAVGGVALLAAGLAATVPARADAAGTRHPLTALAAAPSATPLTSGHDVRLSVGLDRDPAGLEARARAVSTPGSASYQKFLSPRTVSDTYGSTAAQRSAVVSWLRSQGLSVRHVDPFTVTATGTAARVGRAIDASVGRVAVVTAGHTSTQYVPRGTVTVPSSVASVVRSVNLSPLSVEPITPPLPSAASGSGLSNTQPCSRYYGQKIDHKDPVAYGKHQPYIGCWYSPSQVRSAYGFPAKTTGKGVTVATMGSEPLTGGQDSIQRWSKETGVQQLRSGQLTQIGLEKPTAAPVALDEWIGDLEAVHGLAPDANLTYVWSDGSITGDPFADDLSRVVQNRLADVVSASIGDTIYWDDILNPLLQRAALEGITVNEASGDWGNPVNKGQQNGGYLRDTPWETLVGGTSLAIDSHSHYRWETPWAQASTYLNAAGTAWKPAAPGPSEFYYEGGGGASKVSEPWYQQGVAGHNVVDGRARRVSVDVAMEADCYVGGYPEAFYQPTSATKRSSTWYERAFCGTSMASPMFAALEANVIQLRHGTRLGFLNPTLYGLYGSAGFHQVTDTPRGAGVTEAVVRPGITGAGARPAKLITLGQCAAQKASSKPFPLVTPYCGPGYNDVTGLGSPTAALFSLLASGAS